MRTQRARNPLVSIYQLRTAPRTTNVATIAKLISAVRCRSLGPRCSSIPYPRASMALPWRSDGGGHSGAAGDGGRVAPPLGGRSRPRRPSPPTAAPQGAAARGPPPLPQLFPLPDLLPFPHTLRDAEHGLAAGHASFGPSPSQPPSPSLHASPWPRAPLAGRPAVQERPSHATTRGWRSACADPRA